MIISECLTKQWSIKGIVFTNRAHEQIQISFRPFINLQHKKGKKNKNKTKPTKKHYCCHAKPHPNMHCMCSAVNLVCMLSNSYTECSSAAIFHQYSLTLS